MRACRVNLSGCVVDTSLYWREEVSANEAVFLAALFKSPAVFTAFAYSRISVRNFDLQPLARAPDPKLDTADERHQQVFTLTHAAERCAGDFFQKQAASKGYAVTNKRRGPSQIKFERDCAKAASMLKLMRSYDS